MTAPLKVLAPLAALASVSCVQTEVEEPEPVASLSAERTCFFTRQVNGYSEAPEGPTGDRLYVRTGANTRHLLETYGPCPDLDWSLNIALDTRFSGTSLCTGDTVTLLVPRTGIDTPDRCTARVLGEVVD